MIRPVRADDIPRLRELGFDWEFGEDFINGLVAVDENDRPVMVAGAWLRAETHIALDKDWSTPGMRLLLLKELHDAMYADMRARGVGEAVTWFDGKLFADRFIRRLEGWGWMKSTMTSWHRRLL